jgi:hypothetical protein
MQDLFADNEEAVKAFRAGISEARLSRYMHDSNGDVIGAINLYLWNTRLSQALYLPLQTWEVLFRNRLNDFLKWRYSPSWPYDTRPQRELTRNEYSRLLETRQRQERLRNVAQVPTDAIVADLSGGFWVALLSKRYDIPFVWRTNVARIFPNQKRVERLKAHELSLEMLDLRNRVAHHEPIYHLALDRRRADLDWLLDAMCKTTNEFARRACTFEQVWNNPPS